MFTPTAPGPLLRPALHRRAIAFVVVGATLAAAIAATIVVLASAGAATLVPFAPTADDGVIAEGSIVTLDDVDVPAVARLDPALRDAMVRAEQDAAADGIAFQVMSGWRSREYQQWLLEDAIEAHGSEEVARQFVASPDRSTHVTGDGIDIGPLDAQFWLIEHGSQYGICQTYANERWHFELATQPGQPCPVMKDDAAG